jgi:hypothetical protein
MADLVYKSETRLGSLTIDWSAVWSGLFTFVSIWSVFGLLGYAIFPRTTNGGVDVALAIWSIILAAVAMFIAGRVTGSVSAVAGQASGMRHGMIMFGLAVIATIVLKFWGGNLIGEFFAPGTMARGLAPSFIPQNAWIAFGTLCLGWLGAIFGAASAAAPKSEMQGNVKEIRPAA